MELVDEKKLLEVGERNLRWFADNYEELQERHADKFVAVDSGKLLATHDSLDSLLKVIEGRLTSRPFLSSLFPRRTGYLSSDPVYDENHGSSDRPVIGTWHRFPTYGPYVRVV